MAQSNRDQGLIILLGVAAALAATWFFWLSPTQQAIIDSASQITQFQNQQTTLTQRIALVDSTAKDIAATSDAQKLLALAAPTGSSMDNLLASLNTMAVSSSVGLSSVQPQQTSTAGQSAMTVTVSVTGTFSAIQSFVAALEKNIRPITILNLSLASGGTTAGSNLITATLNLSTVQIGSVTAATPTSAGGTQ